MKNVMEYELAGVPPSMFKDNGEMRTTSKCKLKSELKVEATISQRGKQKVPDAIILDGCAILWVVDWPTQGLVKDFVTNVMHYVIARLKEADTLLIFDRYYVDSIKEGTRTSRAGSNASRQHQLSMSTPLPPKNVCLTVSKNKLQLITLICIYLREWSKQLPQNGRKLVVTGPDSIPIEICNANTQERLDLQTTHEEADVIIIKQVVVLAYSGKHNIHVVADDTDVFVLLLHYYQLKELTCKLMMVATTADRKCIDIPATVEKHSAIIGNILTAHALSGCDTTSALCGIGKLTVLKVLKSGKTVESLGNVQVHEKDILLQCTAFIAACYGHSDETDMTTLRFKVWTKKMASHKLNSALKLEVLPPTRESFQQHVRRSHLQAAIWKNALATDPPNLNPTQYGWFKNSDTGTLEPVSLPTDIAPAPPSVLKLIKCGCSTAQPCTSARCSCSVARLSCSLFCACRGENECGNPQTITLDEDE